MLTDKVAVVVGASSGIGLATAAAIASHGAHVVAAGTSDSVTTALDRTQVETVELPSADSLSTMTDRIIRKLGRIDILANMVADNDTEEFLTCPFETWSRHIDGALNSVFIASQIASRSMIKTGGGTIVNLISDAAFQPMPFKAFESTARGGILALSRTMAYELAPYNIRVNTVSAGPLLTEPAGYDIPRYGLDSLASSTPEGRITPEQVAATVVFLASEAASGMTGACIHVTGGAFMPH